MYIARPGELYYRHDANRLFADVPLNLDRCPRPRGPIKVKKIQKDQPVLDDSSSQSYWRVRKFLAHAISRAAIPYVLAGILLAAAIATMGHGVFKNMSAIEAWLIGLGPWGVVAFVALFVVATSFLMPDSMLCIASGALFGIWWGNIAVLFGILIAGALQFTLARRLFRAPIQRQISKRPALAAIQRAVIQDEFRLQVLVRLTPVNPAILNYLLGATHVRLTGFIVACLAHMPAIMVEVYFGHASRNVVKIADGSAKHAFLEDMLLFGGLVASVVVLVMVSRMARRALLEAITESEKTKECRDNGLLTES